MKVINDYRIEKDIILQKWIAFEKVGTSAWVERKRTETFTEIKEWANAQKKKKKGKQNGRKSNRS